ncbi:hypothetical protein QTP88_013372 [Uroleucon formosanum]
MPAACTAEKGDGYEVMEKLIRWIGWKFAVFFLALFLPLLEACESPVHFYSYPASPLTCAERDRERGQCRSCVYRYSGVVRMKGVVVWSKGKERDVCIGDVPTTMDNIRGN